MNNPTLLAFICMGKSIRIGRVKLYFATLFLISLHSSCYVILGSEINTYRISQQWYERRMFQFLEMNMTFISSSELKKVHYDVSTCDIIQLLTNEALDMM